MGTVVEKLSYLADTKDLFKDRLNSLGAEIIENTTFRNYLVWLDNFYINSLNKTDLSENGIVGRTSQDGNPTPENPVEIKNLRGDIEYKVRGKNLFDTSLLPLTKNGITITKNDKGEIVIDGTPNISSGYITFQVGNTSTSELTTYTSSIDNKRDGLGVSIGNGNINLPMGETYASKTFTFNYTFTINPTINIRYDAGTFDNVVINPQLEKNTTKTDYEPYISESFPLSLKSRNLFDKDNINVISAYISGSGKISSAEVDKLIYIPCKPNTTYSLQKMSQETTNYNRFRIGTTTDIPVLRMTVEDYFNAGDGSTLTNKTITTGANANYLVFYCYREDTLTSFEDMISSIQIEEGSTATTYEPYYDIELCNISDYKDRIYSQNGEFYLGKKTGKVTLDGSENYILYSVTGGNLFRNNDIGVSLNNISPISNYFIGVNGSGSRYDGTIYYNYSAVATHTTFDILTSKFNNVEDFKTWLSTHNTEVQYVLATSSTTEITQENYPTLYSQLLAIQEFLTKYKINKEFLLDYSSQEIEY